MSENPVTLDFLAHQQARLLDEMASFRDDMRVQTAIIMRVDNTLAALLTEVRAMHARHDRLARRTEKLESVAGTSGSAA